MESGAQHEPVSLPRQLLAALDIAVFRKTANGFVLISEAPGWLHALWPEVAPEAPVSLAERFLFLDDFLTDAEAFWALPRRELLTSEIWAEADADGHEWLLQASAGLYDGTPLLLLRLAVVDQQRYRAILQESRTLSLEHYRLRKAVNQREILLHCIVHDLSTPLAGVKSSLHLLRDDGLGTDEARELVDLGLRQVEKTRALLQGALGAFVAAVPGDAEPPPDLLDAAHEAVAVLRPVAALRNVRLEVSEEASGGEWGVRGHQQRLERIFFNLIDNALRYAPSGSTVHVRLSADAMTVEGRVEDAGAGVAEDFVPRLFHRFEQDGDHVGHAGLGLYYCRISVEGWGGTIGYRPREGGGACFWFRLPRAAPPSAHSQ